MNDYFKDRMDEIEHRTEQMAEKKKYESEIQLLEEKLSGIDTNYERLKTTNRSNLEMLALKQVDLVVAKETRAFAEDMLKKNEGLLIEEQKKVDDLHWKVWEEERRACDELNKCLSANDSVDFLNNFPLVLKTHKYAYNTTPESEEEIKKAVAEHPEVKRLTAKVAALEREIVEAENSCLIQELKSVFNQLEEFDRQREDEDKETQRLIEALERSHRERIALEAEISDIVSRKTDVPCGKPKLNTRQNNLQDNSGFKNESRRTAGVSLVPNEEKCVLNKVEIRDIDDVDLKIDIKQDKKLKAKKWYEEYTKGLDTADEENKPNNYSPSDITKNKIAEDFKKESCFFTSQNERLSPVKQIRLKDRDKKEDEDVLWERKFSQVNFKESPQPVTSRFFVKTEDHRNNVESTSTGYLKPKNEDVDAPRATDRKFEPLMATPSTFFNPVAADDCSKRSTAVQGILKVKKTVKFTPKKPSSIGNKSTYHQTKLDTFINYMLSDDSKCTLQRK